MLWKYTHILLTCSETRKVEFTFKREDTQAWIVDMLKSIKLSWYQTLATPIFHIVLQTHCFFFLYKAKMKKKASLTIFLYHNFILCIDVIFLHCCLFSFVRHLCYLHLTSSLFTVLTLWSLSPHICRLTQMI